MIIWFLFGMMCTLVVLLALTYFKFSALRIATQEAWNKLDNNMKNRAELIPTLALFAASFEELDRNFVYEFSKMREVCRKPSSLKERIACEGEVTKYFKKIFTAAMDHPELKQDEAFLKLQKNIILAEGKVQKAKKKYNTAARDYNTLTSVIPLNLLAAALEFTPFEYFDFDNSLGQK